MNIKPLALLHNERNHLISSFNVQEQLIKNLQYLGLHQDREALQSKVLPEITLPRRRAEVKTVSKYNESLVTGITRVGIAAAESHTK